MTKLLLYAVMVVLFPLVKSLNAMTEFQKHLYPSTFEVKVKFINRLEAYDIEQAQELFYKHLLHYVQFEISQPLGPSLLSTEDISDPFFE